MLDHKAVHEDKVTAETAAGIRSGGSKEECGMNVNETLSLWAPRVLSILRRHRQLGAGLGGEGRGG